MSSVTSCGGSSSALPNPAFAAEATPPVRFNDVSIESLPECSIDDWIEMYRDCLSMDTPMSAEKALHRDALFKLIMEEIASECTTFEAGTFFDLLFSALFSAKDVAQTEPFTKAFQGIVELFSSPSSGELFFDEFKKSLAFTAKGLEDMSDVAFDIFQQAFAGFPFTANQIISFVEELHKDGNKNKKLITSIQSALLTCTSMLSCKWEQLDIPKQCEVLYFFGQLPFRAADDRLFALTRSQLLKKTAVFGGLPPLIPPPVSGEVLPPPAAIAEDSSIKVTDCVKLAIAIVRCNNNDSYLFSLVAHHIQKKFSAIPHALWDELLATFLESLALGSTLLCQPVPKNPFLEDFNTFKKRVTSCLHSQLRKKELKTSQVASDFLNQIKGIPFDTRQIIDLITVYFNQGSRNKQLFTILQEKLLFQKAGETSKWSSDVPIKQQGELFQLFARLGFVNERFFTSFFQKVDRINEDSKEDNEDTTGDDPIRKELVKRVQTSCIQAACAALKCEATKDKAILSRIREKIPENHDAVALGLLVELVAGSFVSSEFTFLEKLFPEDKENFKDAILIKIHEKILQKQKDIVNSSSNARKQFMEVLVQIPFTFKQMMQLMNSFCTYQPLGTEFATKLQERLMIQNANGKTLWEERTVCEQCDLLYMFGQLGVKNSQFFTLFYNSIPKEAVKQEAPKPAEKEDKSEKAEKQEAPEKQEKVDKQEKFDKQEKLDKQEKPIAPAGRPQRRPPHTALVAMRPVALVSTDIGGGSSSSVLEAIHYIKLAIGALQCGVTDPQFFSFVENAIANSKQEVPLELLIELFACSLHVPGQLSLSKLAARQNALFQREELSFLYQLTLDEIQDIEQAAFESFDIFVEELAGLALSASQILYLIEGLQKRGNKNKNIYIALEEKLLVQDSEGRCGWEEFTTKQQCSLLYFFTQFGPVHTRFFATISSKLVKKNIDKFKEKARYIGTGDQAAIQPLLLNYENDTRTVAVRGNETSLVLFKNLAKAQAGLVALTREQELPISDLCIEFNTDAALDHSDYAKLAIAAIIAKVNDPYLFLFLDRKLFREKYSISKELFFELFMATLNASDGIPTSENERKTFDALQAQALLFISKMSVGELISLGSLAAKRGLMHKEFFHSLCTKLAESDLSACRIEELMLVITSLFYHKECNLAAFRQSVARALMAINPEFSRPRFCEVKEQALADLLAIFNHYASECYELFQRLAEEVFYPSDDEIPKFFRMKLKDALKCLCNVMQHDYFEDFKTHFLKDHITQQYDLTNMQGQDISDCIAYMKFRKIEDAPLFEEFCTELLRTQGERGREKFSKLETLSLESALSVVAALSSTKKRRELLQLFGSKFSPIFYERISFSIDIAKQILEIHEAYDIENCQLFEFILQKLVYRKGPPTHFSLFDSLSMDECLKFAELFIKVGIDHMEFTHRYLDRVSSKNSAHITQNALRLYIVLGKGRKSNTWYYEAVEKEVLKIDFRDKQHLLIDVIDAYAEYNMPPRGRYQNTSQPQREEQPAALSPHFAHFLAKLRLEELSVISLIKLFFISRRILDAAVGSDLTKKVLNLLWTGDIETSQLKMLSCDEMIHFICRALKNNTLKGQNQGHYYIFLNILDTKEDMPTIDSLFTLINEFSENNIRQTELLSIALAEHIKFTAYDSVEKILLRKDGNGKTLLENSPNIRPIFDVLKTFHPVKRDNDKLWKEIVKALLPFKAQGLYLFFEEKFPASVATKIAHALIDEGLAVNQTLSDKSTLLHYAITKRNLPLVEKLLQKGAHVNKRDGQGQTALYKASAAGWIEGVQLLLRYHAAIDGFTASLTSPLWRITPDEMRRFFGSFFADFPEVITALHDVGAIGLVGHLIEHPEHILNASASNPNANPLEAIYFLQDWDLGEAVVSRMANKEILAFFTKLAEKYPVPLTVVAQIIFDKICESRDIESATAAIQISPKSVPIFSGRSYVSSAVGNNLPQVLEKLLELKVNINQQDQRGVVVLHTSCCFGQSAITKLLLANGATLHQRFAGVTPFERGLGAETWDKDAATMIAFYESFFVPESVFMKELKKQRKTVIDYFINNPELLVNDKSENPLKIALLFQSRDLAVRLIPHMTAEEHSSHLAALEKAYPVQTKKAEFITYASYTLRKEGIASDKIEAIIPPELPGVNLNELLAFFDEINFIDKKAPHYHDPEPLYKELKETSVKGLRDLLADVVIRRIQERKVYQGTPDGNTPALLEYYDTIKGALTHVIHKFKTSVNSAENKNKKAETIIELLKTAGACGARIFNVSRTLYHWMVKDTPPTFEGKLQTALGEFRAMLLESLAPTDEGHENNPNIHTAGLLTKYLGKELNIPNVASFEDVYSIKNFDKGSVLKEFFNLYTPEAILTELSQQFRHDEEFRDELIDWWRKNVPKTFEPELYTELTAKLASLPEDADQEAYKQFAKENFLEVKGVYTRAAIKRAIKDQRASDYIEQEVIDGTVMPMQIKKSALLSMLLKFGIIQRHAFKA